MATFCTFVGHNKSGSSLCSALLDAHPDVVLSDEVDLLRYVEHGFQREQLFALAARGARAEARKGRVTARRLEPYSYAVAGGSQGSSPRPLVVGDSTTGTSTRRFGADPDLWDRILLDVRPATPKLLHVIRNPFDPISVMMVRGHRSFANSIDHYFDACATVGGDPPPGRSGRRARGALRGLVDDTAVVTPVAVLVPRRRCRRPRYLDACAAIVTRQPEPSRVMVEWTNPWITTVERRLADHGFLQGYSYDG